MPDAWTGGDSYERFIGRWSRPVAADFIPSLGVRPGARWCDVGCGTGALTAAVLAHADPAEVVGVDPSPAYVAHAGAHVADPRARFAVGGATELPAMAPRDAVVSGLVLNFVPDPVAAVAAMAACATPGGTVAVYVWDYAGDMQVLRRFWDAADAGDLDEGRRFGALCSPEGLARTFDAAGLPDHDVRPIDVDTPFTDFEDFWQPFLGGQGPAPGYVATLDDEARAALRHRLEAQPLPRRARAWAIRARRP